MKTKRGKDTGQNTTFTAEEREAIQALARERKAEARGGKGGREAGEAAVREALASMPSADRRLGERLHALITESAPGLAPKTWYGMPAYANAEGQVVCFFQSAHKFKARYATLGFSDKARLDDGALWPTAFAVAELTPAVEARIRALVRQAAG